MSHTDQSMCKKKTMLSCFQVRFVRSWKQQFRKQLMMNLKNLNLLWVNLNFGWTASDRLLLNYTKWHYINSLIIRAEILATWGQQNKLKTRPNFNNLFKVVHPADRATYRPTVVVFVSTWWVQWLFWSPTTPHKIYLELYLFTSKSITNQN